MQGIAACSDSDMIEQAFGGFDVVQARRRNNSEYGQFVYTLPNGNTTGVKDVATLIMGGAWLYGYALPFCLYTLTGENM